MLRINQNWFKTIIWNKKQRIKTLTVSGSTYFQYYSLMVHVVVCLSVSAYMFVNEKKDDDDNAAAKVVAAEH